MNELIINPHQQHMDAFYWVIDWEGMISVSSLVGLLEKHFFPKWLQVRSLPKLGQAWFKVKCFGDSDLVIAAPVPKWFNCYIELFPS